MAGLKKYLLAVLLIVVPLYPKFPLANVAGSFVAVRLEDVIIGAVAGIWFIANLKNWRVNWQNPTLRAIMLYWVVGALSVFVAIVLTKTVQPHLAVLHWLRRIEYMILFGVGWWTLASKRDLNFFMGLVLIVSVLVGGYGLGQQFLSWPIISTNNSEFSKGLALSLGENARINSTFAGHYDLAAFCLIPLLLVLGIWHKVKGVFNKLFLALAGGVVYWAMLLSASRVTFLALVLAASALAIILKRWILLAPILVLTVVGILASPQLRGRYWEFITNHVLAAEEKNVQTVPDSLKPAEVPEDRSFNIRLRAEWPRALRAFAKNPVLGTGFSSVGLAVDNDYLRILAETGMLGFLAFALIVGRVVKWLWRSDEVFAKVMVCVFGGLLANAVFIDIFEASKIASLTWLLLGMAVKIPHLHHEA